MNEGFKWVGNYYYFNDELLGWYENEPDGLFGTMFVQYGRKDNMFVWFQSREEAMREVEEYAKLVIVDRVGESLIQGVP